MPEIVFVRQTGLCTFDFRGRYPLIPDRGCVSRPHLRCVSSQPCNPCRSVYWDSIPDQLFYLAFPLSRVRSRLSKIHHPPAFLLWGSQLTIFYLCHRSFSDWVTGTLSIWKAVPFGCEVTNSRSHFILYPLALAVVESLFDFLLFLCSEIS